MTNTALIPTLGFLGYIPFAVGALLSVLGLELRLVDAELLFTSYSAIILSFLAGTLWGRALPQAGDRAAALLLPASNLLALLAWLGLVWQIDRSFTVGCLMLGYIVVFTLEHRFRESLSGGAPEGSGEDYLRLRFTLTSLVLLAHLVILIMELL